MNRADALPYVGHCVDDTLNHTEGCRSHDIPDNARLVGWQCGFEPMFVAVWSYLDIRLEDEEAIDIAIDLLDEIGWFNGEPPREPDHVI
ncbi:hypothetical protein J7E62_24535 [Variovorax paradoxus]|nr:hypothetical protein [Variovorax paradoxus]